METEKYADKKYNIFCVTHNMSDLVQAIVQNNDEIAKLEEMNSKLKKELELEKVKLQRLRQELEELE